MVNGAAEESFEPEREVTREEFIKMLVIAFHISGDKDMDFAFSDVTKDMWSYPYIKTAYIGGVARGMSKTYFGANERITRQDAAVMLANILRIEEGTDGISDFADSSEIAPYARTAVLEMVRLGIMTGIEERSFAPLQYTSRAQAVTLIGRVLK